MNDVISDYTILTHTVSDTVTAAAAAAGYGVVWRRSTGYKILVQTGY